MRRPGDLPAFSLLLVAAAALMLVPAAHAAHLGDWRVARAFFYHAVFFVIFALILGLALATRRPRRVERYQLLTLLLAYLLLPVVLALPLQAATPLPFLPAYFEMVSSLTTTGATMFDRYWLVSPPIHLWRALVGWAGGFMILVAAFAVLAPLNLGGFEIVRADADPAEGRRAAGLAASRERILRIIRTIGPVYILFTFVLMLLLVFAGDRPFVALCHAMATISTSGISPIGGPGLAASGVTGEALIALFLLSAVSHRSLTLRPFRSRRPHLRDPEVQIMLISIGIVTLVLFLRAFIGAIEAERQANLAAAARAVWGSLFTVLAHLTTSGFESRHWVSMQIWSRLEAPGIILLGVAAMGGGIATTAGGIKLLRLFALYRHGLRELDLLIHPSTAARRTSPIGRITEGGTRIAFVFLMLFLMTIAILAIALASVGLTFEESLTLAIAGLTTTGPLIATLEDASYRELPEAARLILCAAMIVGRMEVLVIIAMFNPAYWRS